MPDSLNSAFRCLCGVKRISSSEPITKLAVPSHFYHGQPEVSSPFWAPVQGSSDDFGKHLEFGAAVDLRQVQFREARSPRVP